MNVIIANKYKDALSNLNIDVIKRMDGEFDVNTIIDTFKNFYFNRMILDITALKNHFDITVMQELSANLDASKIILFLDDDPRINNLYLSKIISLGIYNFTRDLSGVTYLMENPNSYRDVAQYHDLAMNDKSMPASNMSFPGSNNPFSNTSSANTYGNAYNYNQPYSSPSNNGGFTQFGGQNDYGYNQGNNYSSNTLVIGFKDLTDDAGSTTLIYMLKKQLKGHKVLAVELNKNDFSYFNDSELISVQANQMMNVKNKFSQFEIVLVDINKSSLDTDGTCTEVIYLLDPSTIKLNALMRRDRGVLEKIRNKKVVLNKSMLSQSDVKEFEYESKVPIFFNIPPLDDRKDHQMVLDSFLEKLGVLVPNSSEEHKESGGFFGLFKKQS